MKTMLWIFCALFANALLGAFVWSAIDDDQQTLLAWFKSCPPRVAMLVQPLVLMAWPVGLWFWWSRRR